MDRQSDASSAETAAVGPASFTSACTEEGRCAPGTLPGGRYRIIALLGRGGIASRNQRLPERFHGEVRIARQISHPDACRVYDISEVEGMPFISMEYVDGEDLASLLTRIGRLPADKAIEAARRLCAGLAPAHDRGIIHRDLKPQNIMISIAGAAFSRLPGSGGLLGDAAETG